MEERGAVWGRELTELQTGWTAWLPATLSEEGLCCAGCISQGSSGKPKQQGVCLCTHRGERYFKERLMKWWGW